jgi:hypothetical protein
MEAAVFKRLFYDNFYPIFNWNRSRERNGRNSTANFMILVGGQSPARVRPGGVDCRYKTLSYNRGSGDRGLLGLSDHERVVRIGGPFLK